jgi:probable rRNA maturation factor
MTITHSAVQFHFPSPCSLTRRLPLKAYILSMFKKEKQPLKSVNIVFCDDEFLLSLNRRFLRHDYYTDILSFRLSAKRAPLVAEIYISTDRVRDNAINLETSFRKELHRVIFHGILHFCGYGDKSRGEISQMRAQEDKYLDRYFGRRVKGSKN